MLWNRETVDHDFVLLSWPHWHSLLFSIEKQVFDVKTTWSDRLILQSIWLDLTLKINKSVLFIFLWDIKIVSLHFPSSTFHGLLCYQSVMYNNLSFDQTIYDFVKRSSTIRCYSDLCNLVRFGHFFGKK